MSKPIVICDLDGIVANLLDLWLGRYNAHMTTQAALRREPIPKDVTVDDIIQFDIHKCVPIGQKIYDFIRKPGIYSDLAPIDGAVDGLAVLNRDCDVLILSTPSREPETAAEKIRWCERHLPFLNRRQIMLGARKELVIGDYLIDDSPQHLVKWKDLGGAFGKGHFIGETITIDYPYNRDVQVDFRAQSYKNTRAAWFEIVQFIQDGP